MLKRYKEFLKIFDKHLLELSNSQKKYLKCKKGCSLCCENGDYPFSRLEMEYLMSGYIKLPEFTKKIIKSNLSSINNKQEYRCPFLIDNLCSIYEYRGLVCRTHGLAYLYNDTIKLPNCANIGLNYGNIFNKETGEIYINNPIKESLRIDDIFNSPLAQDFNLEKGEIRKLIDWFM